MPTPEKRDAPEMSTIKGRGSVEVGGSVTAQAGADQKVRKVIVASRVLRLTRDLTARFLGGLVALILAFLAVAIGERMGPGPVFITQTTNAQYLAATAVLTIVTLFIGSRWPSLGLKPLIVLGTGTIAVFVVNGLLKEPDKLGPVWPIFLALAAFLYLWWLAALILDLVLVWHLLVHNPARVRRSLASMAGESREAA